MQLSIKVSDVTVSPRYIGVLLFSMKKRVHKFQQKNVSTQ